MPEALGLLLGLFVGSAVAVPQVAVEDELGAAAHHLQVDVAAGGGHLGHGAALASWPSPET